MNLSGKKIMIFDDDKDILDICTYALENAGGQVFTFQTCDNLLNKVEEIHPDVILMDNWIPAEGGIAATQLLKSAELLQHIPVIYFSANSNIASLSEQAGADAFLPKPFDLDELEKAVSDMAGT